MTKRPSYKNQALNDPRPQVTMSWETAANVSLALRQGDTEAAYVFPASNALGAVYVENYSNGSSQFGWLNASGEAVLGLSLGSRKDALFWAEGFMTASTQVSENRDAVATIKTPEIVIMVSETVDPDDPRAASPEAMQAFLDRVSRSG